MVRSNKSNKAVPSDHGDSITVNNKGDNNAIAVGRGARADIYHAATSADMDVWRKEMGKSIGALKNLLPVDKIELKENVDKVAKELSKGKQADSGRLERLLNMIGGMAPEILDVALTTLVSPLAGLGLVAKKIGERAKLEASS